MRPRTAMEHTCRLYNTLQLYVQAHRFMLVALRELKAIRTSRRPRILSGTRLQAAAIAASSLRGHIGTLAHAYGYEIACVPRSAPWTKDVPGTAGFPGRTPFTDAYDAENIALAELARARDGKFSWGNRLDAAIRAMSSAADAAGRLDAAIGADLVHGIWVVRNGDGRFLIAPQGDPAAVLIRGPESAAQYLDRSHAAAVASALAGQGILYSPSVLSLAEALDAPDLAERPSVWLHSAVGVAARLKNDPVQDQDEHWQALIRALR